MVKSIKPKSDLQVRAALRAGEERRLLHAQQVLHELICKHSVNLMDQEHDLNEIHQLGTRLTVAIKNQHVRDRTVAQSRMKEYTTGDY